MMDNSKLYVSVGISLLVGFAGGYAVSQYDLLDYLIESPQQQQAEKVQNPLANIKSNPLEDVKTNPYEDVKLNPFE